jgi:hypothetical protein
MTTTSNGSPPRKRVRSASIIVDRVNGIGVISPDDTTQQRRCPAHDPANLHDLQIDIGCG